MPMDFAACRGVELERHAPLVHAVAAADANEGPLALFEPLLQLSYETTSISNGYRSYLRCIVGVFFISSSFPSLKQD